MPAQLMSLGEGPSILLDKPILLFGRDLECDIRLDSRKISRRHCCLAQVGDRLVIRDLGSTNGIRINGVRVLEGHLRSGDELTIGNFRYQIRWDSMPMDPSTSAKIEKRDHADKPVFEAGDDDEILEEADEPIPLDDEPPAQIKVLKARPTAEKQIDKPSHRPPDSQEMMIPDDLELAPSSDVVPGDRPPTNSPNPINDE